MTQLEPMPRRGQACSLSPERETTQNQTQQKKSWNWSATQLPSIIVVVLGDQASSSSCWQRFRSMWRGQRCHRRCCRGRRSGRDRRRGRPCQRWRSAAASGRKGVIASASSSEAEGGEGSPSSEVKAHGWQWEQGATVSYVVKGIGQGGVRGGVTHVCSACAEGGMRVATVTEEKEQQVHGAVHKGEGVRERERRVIRTTVLGRGNARWSTGG